MKLQPTFNSLDTLFSNRISSVISPKNASTPSFEPLVDQLLSAAKPRSKPTGTNPIREFQRKLAFLSGMAEQARAAMAGAPNSADALPSSESQNYYFWVSKLNQAGCPDGVNNLI
jgi:hypothetical protein